MMISHDSRRQVPIQQSRAFQTRSTLLDAAEKVLLVSGPAALTLDQVAREAGLSKGAVLYHFPTKQILHVELAKRLCLEFFGEADHHRATSGEPWCLAALSLVEQGSTKYATLVSMVTVILDTADETWQEVNREIMERLAQDGLDEASQALVYCAMGGFITFTAEEGRKLASLVKQAVRERLFAARLP